MNSARASASVARFLSVKLTPRWERNSFTTRQAAQRSWLYTITSTSNPWSDHAVTRRILSDSPWERWRRARTADRLARETDVRAGADHVGQSAAATQESIVAVGERAID